MVLLEPPLQARWVTCATSARQRDIVIQSPMQSANTSAAPRARRCRLAMPHRRCRCVRSAMSLTVKRIDAATGAGAGAGAGAGVGRARAIFLEAEGKLSIVFWNGGETLNRVLEARRNSQSPFGSDTARRSVDFFPLYLLPREPRTLLQSHGASSWLRM